jgi:hypothetical protein
MGRFMSPDDVTNDTHRANPQTWNLYAYARNNPLRFVDPTGESVRDGVPDCYETSAMNAAIYTGGAEINAGMARFEDSISAWLMPQAQQQGGESAWSKVKDAYKSAKDGAAPGHPPIAVAAAMFQHYREGAVPRPQRETEVPNEAPE